MLCDACVCAFVRQGQLGVPHPLSPVTLCAFGQVIEHAMSCPDVWVCRRLDIAEHWLRAHPPDAARTLLQP